MQITPSISDTHEHSVIMLVMSPYTTYDSADIQDIFQLGTHMHAGHCRKPVLYSYLNVYTHNLYTLKLSDTYEQYCTINI